MSFTPQFGITGNFDPISGQLILIGQADLTQYESVLHSITYENSSDNPSTVNRTIDFFVNDGVVSSNVLSRDIEFTAVNDPPVLSSIEITPAIYIENSPPLDITGNLIINDLDDTLIDAATITISNG